MKFPAASSGESSNRKEEDLSTGLTPPQAAGNVAGGFTGKKISVLALPGWSPKGVEETPVSLTRFFQAFRSRFPDSEWCVLKNGEDMKTFAEEKTKKTVLLLSKDLASDASQHRFVKMLARHSGKIACAVCVKNPEDARFLKLFAHTILCTLGFEEENWETVLGFLEKG